MNKIKCAKFRSGKQGFTLIELLVYLTIVSVVVNTLIIFSIDLIKLKLKSSQQQAVSATAATVAGKIKYEIRNAADLNLSSSDFGLNLADNPTKKISLAQTGADDPTIFDVSDGSLRIARGVSAPAVLNPTGTRISDLTFTNLSSADGSTKQLKFTLTVTAVTPSPGNIYETISLESSAELRSH
ncbi:MAG TPA: prepilin-type N-terminal cleavage/methylation domain-containing protein [Patescibacteria group bacterium]|nr:prepilin-type N-terminal cleavage/methylation domain-containing protein [Patescibacteria group bacterium]